MEVEEIVGSLSPNTDLRDARSLQVNRRPKVCFQGQTPQHTPGFVISADIARRLVREDQRSERYLYPYLTGNELNLTGQPARFVVDLDAEDLLAAELAAPALVAYLHEAVLPDRQAAAEREAERNREHLAANPSARVNTHKATFLERWWQLGWRRHEMVDALSQLDR